MKPLPLLLLAMALPAGAQALHKCTIDGKVSYSQQPCEKGVASTIEVPAAPAPDPAAAANLKRQERDAEKLASQRRKREAREERESLAEARAVASHNKKCKKLQMQHKWAEEDARGATLQNTERAKQKAKRAADMYQLECGG
ncbi:DUF4124 domain-containing protein [Duganella sp. Root1480D1]|uniref:DUF4124 domain-containing protein n=1 Tax=Duganella sp. Root1480D1 TaxID=1736471 RepID=UPI00070FC364|nr:DUF4124 domain-containing protein [Duganella sp. Root1480D1]KQZ27017.1 hypothetical protein ASD58_15670 [Duganella sp. Root1480D1]